MHFRETTEYSAYTIFRVQSSLGESRGEKGVTSGGAQVDGAKVFPVGGIWQRHRCQVGVKGTQGYTSS